jgi:hypothetical protein
MTDSNGQTALHRACRDRRSTSGDIQRLIDEDPQALAKRDTGGNTPLHMACMFLHQSPDILQVLLDRSPVEVVGMCSSPGFTPLHLACRYSVSVDILRQMIHLYPKALRTFNIEGNTPLHMAGFSPEASLLEKLELLILHCPESCLLLNHEIHSPYDRAIGRIVELDVVALMAAATINALLAFLVCAHQSVVPVTPTMMTHIRQVLPGLFEEGSSISYMNGNEAIRQALANHATLKTLLQNDELQAYLKEEDCQDLIRGAHRLVQAGRNHTRHEDFKDHMCILESVSEHQTFCIYIYGATQLFATVRLVVVLRSSSKSQRLQNIMPNLGFPMMLHKLNAAKMRTIGQSESERRPTIFAISPSIDTVASSHCFVS